MRFYEAGLIAGLACAAPLTVHAASLTCDFKTIHVGFPGVHCTISNPPLGSAYTDCLWTAGAHSCTDAVFPPPSAYCVDHVYTCDSQHSATCTTAFVYEYPAPGTYQLTVSCTMAHTTAHATGGATITVKP